jgi:hypothetical protein
MIRQRCPLALALAVAAAALCCGSANGAINMTVWANTAFGPAAAGIVTQVPGIFLSSPDQPDYTSVRWDGTLTPNVTEYVLFSAITDGSVRLWVDDHLVIDDQAVGTIRNASGILNVPVTAGMPLPLRVEYAHWNGTAQLELFWQGNFTQRELVPPAALDNVLPPYEAQRQAMRDRLYTPPVPWQTYNNPSFCTHVNMPSAFGVDLTIGDRAGDAVVLGPVYVYHPASPANVFVGPHSANGSDYTQLTIFGWGNRTCNVTIETTVVAAAGGERSDLLVLATSTGADCAHMVLLVQPVFLWGRAGTVNSSGPGHFAGYPGGTGLAPTAVFSSTGGSGVAFPNVTTGFALPLSPVGGALAISTGANYSVSTIQAAVAEAAAREAAALDRFGELSDLYGILQAVLWWNTIYTPYEGVVTPVSRGPGWDFGYGCEYCRGAAVDASKGMGWHSVVPNSSQHCLTPLPFPFRFLYSTRNRSPFLAAQT